MSRPVSHRDNCAYRRRCRTHFKKVNVGFLILMLLKLTVDTVLAIFKAASSYQDRVNIFL